MAVGCKGGGKHWTRREVESRARAAQSVTRRNPVKIKPPQWVKDDPATYRIWQKIVRDLRDVELLDNLDSLALATFCCLEAAKERAVQESDINLFDKLSRTSLTYANALGLTAKGRASLAKKRAEKPDDPNAELFE